MVSTRARCYPESGALACLDLPLHTAGSSGRRTFTQVFAYVKEMRWIRSGAEQLQQVSHCCRPARPPTVSQPSAAPVVCCGTICTLHLWGHFTPPVCCALPVTCDAEDIKCLNNATS